MSTLRVDSIQDTAGTDNQGKILQVVYFDTPTVRFQGTVTTFTDTGFSVTITPKFANSKIKINFSASVVASTHYVYLDIFKNGTTVTGGDSTNGLTGPVAYYTSYWQNISGFVFDSPNTTSAVTYNIYARTASGNVTIGSQTGTVFPNAVLLSATEIAQ
jgi:hypothetical protein